MIPLEVPTSYLLQLQIAHGVSKSGFDRDFSMISLEVPTSYLLQLQIAHGVSSNGFDRHSV